MSKGAMTLTDCKALPAGVMETKEPAKWLINLIRWGILAAVLILWEIGGRMGWIDRFYFSCPSEIVQTAVVKWRTGDLLRDIAYTAGSTLLGFVSGTLIGTLIGLLFWFSKGAARVADPWLIVINALPKLALAPILVILFGIGFASKVVLAFLMTVVVAAMSAASGVSAVDPALLSLFYSLKASRLRIFCQLVVPSAMRSVVTGLRVNIGLSMAGAIVGEFVASDRGLGRMIVYAGTTFDLKLVWVGVIVLSILSLVMYAAVAWLEKVLSRLWHMSI